MEVHNHVNCSSHAARAGWKGLLEAVVADRAFLYPYLFSMAVGKNKKLSKGKGNRKRAVDPFTRKEWYDIKAPVFFENRNVGKTIVNRSQGLSMYRVERLTLCRELGGRSSWPYP